MDFIEQLFGISPDGGSGALEALWVVALVAVVGALAWRRRAMRKG
jgi:MYXO-CTERM domain-containing protein